MSFGGQVKADPNKQAWENAEFPILCQTCLGDNPYIRMQKERHGKECKICTRPFTVFRWCPGRGARYKKTEVCQTCSKLKNVCQTCILDLEYGLPVQVRDDALGMTEAVPQSEVNKEYFAQNMENQIQESGDQSALCLPTTRVGKQNPELLRKLARSDPYYKRNRPHICSFYVKGDCKRGEECPYRHEMPQDPNSALAKQNIKDRYYGQNDPVAEKMMKRAEELPKLTPPTDKSVMTLYLGGLSTNCTENDIKDSFYQYGEIAAIVMVPRQACCFITFSTREGAEEAAEKTHDQLHIKGRKIKMMWGKSQKVQSNSIENAQTSRLAPVPGLPPAPGAKPGPQASLGIHYSSQDPSRLGTQRQ